MHFTKLGAAVSLVQLGQAILLPPTISSADSELINTLPFEDNALTQGRKLDLACPGCPVIIQDLQGQAHYAENENSIRIDLSIAEGENGIDQLVVNGLPIYPMEPMSDSFLQPLTAPQLIKTNDDTWTMVAEPVLGYALSVRHPVHSEQDQLDLVFLHIEIVEVANKFLNSVPSIDIKLVETPSGRLMLGDVEILPPTPSPSDGGQECTTLLCKWRAIIAAKLSKVKGMGCGSKARPAAAVEGPKDNGRPQPPRPAGRPHGHHHQKHEFGRFLRNVAAHILLPILVGVAVGITASLVGMLVGNLVVFIWRVLFRRGGQYTRVQQNDIVIEEDCRDEKKGFLEVQGPPPTYDSVDDKA
ncbi:hypothetical protein HYFRA_00001783 [Hymenoscyphus fraxineus]|uniref:DUF7728 domain-containing protein n=1 Tax=Hymenoscyphus fraxineus TaxID=746836 RepID=A0A9N9KKK2_9HELO|nr:hypothetical protein HYFRA_00001783 [Hymenoscyphus fraxineus]